MTISKKIIDGKVSFEVFVKVRDSSGKQIGKRKKGIPTEREAKRIEFEIRSKLEGFRSMTTWKNFVEHFLARYKIEYRPATHINYKFILDKWMNPVWNDRYLEDIAPSDVHNMVFEHVHGVSSYHRKTMLKIIKRIFSMAIEEGVMNRNPAVGIKVRVPEAIQSVLNKNEVTILLREAKAVKHRFYSHWCLAVLTGMRSGELHCLRWTDVDFVTGFISISKSWTRYNGEGPTKTAKNRVYPMSNECRLFLQELKLELGNSEYVLPRLWEWDHGCQGKIIREFCTGIGITPITFHDLRATFITQMLNNGVPLAKVMSIVGHTSLKTTQGYLRLSGKDVEGATEALDICLPRDADLNGKVIKMRKE